MSCLWLFRIGFGEFSLRGVLCLITLVRKYSQCVNVGRILLEGCLVSEELWWLPCFRGSFGFVLLRGVLGFHNQSRLYASEIRHQAKGLIGLLSYCCDMGLGSSIQSKFVTWTGIKGSFLPNDQLRVEFSCKSSLFWTIHIHNLFLWSRLNISILKFFLTPGTL